MKKYIKLKLLLAKKRMCKLNKKNKNRNKKYEILKQQKTT